MLNFPRFAVPRAKTGSRLFAAADLRRYSPGWGIPCSLAFHEVALIILLLWSVLHNTREPFRVPERAAPPKRTQVAIMMYFPRLVPGNRPAAPKPEAGGKPASPASARKPAGMVYPGPQEIVSDPPQPTNQVQTISQPDLVNPPVVEPAPALPNLLMTARDAAPEEPAFVEPVVEVPRPVTPDPAPPLTPAEPEEVKPEPPAKTEAPVLVDRLAPVVSEPVLPLPAPPAAVPALVKLPGDSLPPRTDDVPVEKPKTEQPQEQAESVRPPSAPVKPPGQSEGRNLLAISPMPAEINGPIELPAGQASAQFAISPKPNLTVPETRAVSAPGNTSDAVPAAEAPAPVAHNAVTDAPPRAVTVSFGGPANRTLSSVDGANGPGGATRSVSGRAISITTGSSAAGPGNSPFAGITVSGQTGGVAAAAPAVRITAARPLQTAYGVTVVSTESSGGGLPFSGIFAGRQIHTVYLDMRQSEAESTPAWTLEFAVPGKATRQTILTHDASDGRQGVVLPFPARKKSPPLPRDLVLEHVGKMIIVSGTISIDGKVERASVVASPDPRFDEAVLRALGEWVFRPARLDGTPIPVEFLLGIPLSAHQVRAMRSSTE